MIMLNIKKFFLLLINSFKYYEPTMTSFILHNLINWFLIPIFVAFGLIETTHSQIQATIFTNWIESEHKLKRVYTSD